MKLRKPSHDTHGDIRTVACILAAMMLFIFSFPSFAADENDAKETSAAEDAIPIEEIQGETEENAEGTDTQNVQEETAEGAGEGNDEERADAGNAGIVREEPEKTTGKPERAVVLKVGNGENVSYTAKRVGSNAGETSVFSVISGGTTYTGACAEQGVSMKTSGKAAITRIDNNEKIAKVIYYYAIALGSKNWWSGSDASDKVGRILGMSHDSDTDVTKRRMVECFCQIYNMGSSKWYSTVTSSSGGGWSTNTADKVRDYYRSIDTDSISIPAGFEIWYAKTEGSAQSFIMWAYNPEGYVTMNKVSGNTVITN